MTAPGAVDSDSRPLAARTPLMALRDRANTVLPGIYAWVVTVLLPSVQRTAPALSRVTAFMALVALVAAPLFLDERPRLGRALGVYGFIGGSVLTWVLLGASLLQNRGDPLLSSLGAAAFMLYGLGWGSLRRRGLAPEDGPDVIAAAPLQPRARPPVAVPVVFGLIIAAALVPTFLAFRVADRERGLFAHAAAVLTAIVSISVGARVALGLGQQRGLPSPLDRLSAAAVPLALLALGFGLGFLWLVLR